jgi:TFIIF-interacting CTD phosphatase-like protein
MMVQADRAHLIDNQTAIDDWVVVHWAVEIAKPDWISDES